MDESNQKTKAFSPATQGQLRESHCYNQDDNIKAQPKGGIKYAIYRVGLNQKVTKNILTPVAGYY
jgi:hypothetical protein